MFIINYNHLINDYKEEDGYMKTIYETNGDGVYYVIRHPKQSPILLFTLKHDIISYKLSLNDDRSIHLDVDNYGKHFSYDSVGKIIDIYEKYKEEIFLNARCIIVSEFMNTVYETFLQSEICVKLVNNSEEFIEEAFCEFINASLKYYSIRYHIYIEYMFDDYSKPFICTVEDINALIYFFSSMIEPLDDSGKLLQVDIKSFDDLCLHICNVKLPCISLKLVPYGRELDRFMTLSIPLFSYKNLNKQLLLRSFYIALCRLLVHCHYYKTNIGKLQSTVYDPRWLVKPRIYCIGDETKMYVENFLEIIGKYLKEVE